MQIFWTFTWFDNYFVDPHLILFGPFNPGGIFWQIRSWLYICCLPCTVWFPCSEARGRDVCLQTGGVTLCRNISAHSKCFLCVCVLFPPVGKTCTHAQRVYKKSSLGLDAGRKSSRADWPATDVRAEILEFRFASQKKKNQRSLEIDHALLLLQTGLGSFGGNWHLHIFLIGHSAPPSSCSTCLSGLVPAPPEQEATSEGRPRSGLALAAAAFCTRPAADLYRRDTHLSRSD